MWIGCCGNVRLGMSPHCENDCVDGSGDEVVDGDDEETGVGWMP